MNVLLFEEPYNNDTLSHVFLNSSLNVIIFSSVLLQSNDRCVGEKVMKTFNSFKTQNNTKTVR